MSAPRRPVERALNDVLRRIVAMNRDLQAAANRDMQRIARAWRTQKAARSLAAYRARMLDEHMRHSYWLDVCDDQEDVFV